MCCRAARVQISSRGRAGRDTASYAEAAGGVFVRLWSGEGLSGEALGDVLTGIENLRGSAFADTLVGDNGVNELTGGAGADALWAGDGDDVLSGGAGADQLQGQGGTRHGQLCRGGRRRLRAPLVGRGAERRGAGRHADGDREPARLGLRRHAGGRQRRERAIGGAGADALWAGDGDDVLWVVRGNDVLYGQAGADTFVFFDNGAATRSWVGRTASTGWIST
jgi:serralysin